MRTRPIRPAFTIVELLVAAALIVFIMAILATVFSTGTETFRHLKAQGDMQDQLRSAEVVIKNDLSAHHFPHDATRPNGGVRLSDQRTDQGIRPQGGFFRIRSRTTILENVDDQSIASSRAGAAQEHLLHFTTILPGGTEDKLFGASVTDQGGNPKPYNSTAAEIAYFLDPQQTGTTGVLPLYNLCRRQRLVATDTATRANLPPNAVNTTSDPAVISLSSGTVNLITDLVDPNLGKRLGGVAGMPVQIGNDSALAPVGGLNGVRIGDDVLLSNVISFEVKVLWTEPNSTNPGARAFVAGTGTTDYPFDTLEEARGNPEFDTGTPTQIRVKGVQIRLRVWDAKTKTARQVTILQDL